MLEDFPDHLAYAELRSLLPQCSLSYSGVSFPHSIYLSSSDKGYILLEYILIFLFSVLPASHQAEITWDYRYWYILFVLYIFSTYKNAWHRVNIW